MLPRHRRYLHSVGDTERRRPRLLIRLVVIVLVVWIAWVLLGRILALFGGGTLRAAAQMTVKPGAAGVQVSLQGGDWQAAEGNLKLYAGDAVSAKGTSDGVIQFFDGTRIRLEQGSEIEIIESDRHDASPSYLQVSLKSGRLWVTTPSPTIYTGAIIRTVTTTKFDAEIPAATSALLSATTATVVQGTGIGVKLTFTSVSGKPSAYVGEGQYYRLTADAEQRIASGGDPYDPRDPVTAEVLKDEFLTSSYAQFSSNALPVIAAAVSSGTTLPVSGTDLVVTGPADNASVTTKTVVVSGTVSSRVTTVLVNNQTVSIKNLAFQTEVPLTKDPKTTIKIAVQDAQGIALKEVNLSVTNGYKAVVEPVTIKSPVGSGQTLTTGLQEVEITGEAPAGTAAIMVNEYKLQLYKAGSRTWGYLASASIGSLKMGANVYTVYALDADGNKSPGRSITIIMQAPEATSGSGTTTSNPPIKENPPIQPGTLSVSAPVAGTAAEVTEKEVTIEGATSAETASISVNGYTLSLYVAGKTTWNYIASVDLQTMKRGKNVYRIVSRNSKGEILDVLEYTITYKP